MGQGPPRLSLCAKSYNTEALQETYGICSRIQASPLAQPCSSFVTAFSSLPKCNHSFCLPSWMSGEGVVTACSCRNPKSESHTGARAIAHNPSSFLAAELEFTQILIIVVVVTVMVVVVVCLLNHYKVSTRSFINRPNQSQRQEDGLQPVSVWAIWNAPGECPQTGYNKG